MLGGNRGIRDDSFFLETEAIVQNLPARTILLRVEESSEKTPVATKMGTVLLGKLQKRLRFEGIFGFNAKFLPTIYEEVALGRKLLEKFDTSRVEVGAHGILGVENLQLRNYIYTEHLRLGACDCARATILRKETI